MAGAVGRVAGGVAEAGIQDMTEKHREISWSDLPQKAHSEARGVERRTQGNPETGPG